jgi:hypothetical protein
VHYWNVLYAYFFFFLGLGGALADPLRAAAPAIVSSARVKVRRQPAAFGGMPMPDEAFVHPGLPYGRMSAGRL